MKGIRSSIGEIRENSSVPEFAVELQVITLIRVHVELVVGVHATQTQPILLVRLCVNKGGENDTQ
jgi:hypothetical protein